jgi:RNA polymerase sigma-70 factor (ECF subfamily)
VRAFESIVTRHERRVLRVIRFLGVPAADQEDVAQEVFIRVFRHLSAYRKGRSFAAWVYKIAVNAVHDWRGSARRRSEDEIPWTDEAETKASEPDEGAEGPRIQLARRLESALAELTERERAVFVLKELEGLESSEVAQALGISSITVRRHLGQARERLQKKLRQA